jgi:aspartyl-tRNA(Asn)/glutamyl-tRNA(Gln) amidotransferase subunit A
MALFTEYPSIPDLTRAFRDGLVSPVEALDEALSAVARHNEALRAVVALDAEAARQAAQASRDRYRAGRPCSPLDGVPITVKDLMDVAGVPTRYGTAWVTAPPPAPADSPLVARLKAAGAVVFAKTRLLEFAYGIVNPEDGPCRNPWDLERTSGGSSSGAAAGVAVGMGYGAIGTDTGGSIRIPAAYCGVFGLKPTKGAIPVAGVFPLSWTLDHVGPLCRHAADLGPLWEVLSGRPLKDVGLPERPRLGVLAGVGQDPVTPAVRAAVEGALDQVERAGWAVVPVRIPALEDAEALLMTIVMAEAAAVHAAFSQREHVRYAPLTKAQLDAGQHIAAADYLRALMLRRELRRAVAAAFDTAGIDALAMPTVGFVAPASDPVFGDGDEGSREAWFTGPWNVTGQPAVSVPLPTLVDGLPVGLQLVARYGADAALIALAERVAAVWELGIRQPIDRKRR